jgi:hypothetical protein
VVLGLLPEQALLREPLLPPELARQPAPGQAADPGSE